MGGGELPTVGNRRSPRKAARQPLHGVGGTGALVRKPGGIVPRAMPSSAAAATVPSGISSRTKRLVGSSAAAARDATAPSGDG